MTPPKIDRGPWLRDGRTVYTLKHGGWEKGKELLVNKTWFGVYGETEEDGQATAEHIVQALSSHDELVAALKDLLHADGGVLAFARTNPKAIAAVEALKKAGVKIE